MLCPWAISYALLAYGYAFWDAEPAAALDPMRRGPAIAQDMGIRSIESHLAQNLARLQAKYGSHAAALDYLTLSIRNYHRSGNTETMRGSLAILAVLLNGVGRREQAAMIIGYALSALTAVAFSELAGATAELRDALGEQTYESLTGRGAAMTAAIVAYAYDQIDQVRTEIEEPRVGR